MQRTEKSIPTKVKALIFNQFQNGYNTVGAIIGQALNAGVKFMKK